MMTTLLYIHIDFIFIIEIFFAAACHGCVKNVSYYHYIYLSFIFTLC